MEAVNKHLEMTNDDKIRIQNNLDQMKEEWKKIEIYREEWKKVEEHNQKIHGQILKIVMEEGEDSPNISKLSMELMAPSVEAVFGIESGQTKISQLIEENKNILKSEPTYPEFNLSKKLIIYIILNILFWGIALYLLFFGPSLRKF